MSTYCDTVIVLESNEELGKLVTTAIEARTGFRALAVTSPLEAVSLIHDQPDRIFVAVADFTARGVDALLDKVAENTIPSVVYAPNSTTTSASESLPSALPTPLSGHPFPCPKAWHLPWIGSGRTSP